MQFTYLLSVFLLTGNCIGYILRPYSLAMCNISSKRANVVTTPIDNEKSEKRAVLSIRVFQSTLELYLKYNV